MREVPKTRKDIQEAVLDSARFFYKELGIEQTNVRIGYKAMPEYRKGSMNQYKNTDGSVCYPIYLNEKNDFYQSISTMAHEMVHVKQYVRKDFIRRDIGPDLWKGYDLSWIPYSFKPWELEAFRREIGLFDKYIAHKEYPTPGIGFKFDLYASSLVPYFVIIEIILVAFLLGRQYFGR